MQLLARRAASSVAPARGTSRRPFSAKAMASGSPFYGLEAKTLRGKPFPFSALEGKPVLVVNVASQCGFTPQYAGLQKLYEEFKDKGLQVVGFPCNQFGGQEPGGEDEITTCQLNFGVTFPIMEKVDVNGPNASPVYQYLKSQKSQEKFLVDGSGKVVERYSSIATPESIAPAITKLL